MNITGRYVVTGWNPGVEQIPDKAYEGWAEIEQHGDCYRFVAHIDQQSWEGAGIFIRELGVVSVCFEG